MRDREAYETVVADVEENVGPIAVLCNNAGVGGGASVTSMTYEMWDWVLCGNPTPGMLVADLTDDQRARLREVLDGILRERSDGNGRAVLTNEVNIGFGTK